MDPKTSKTEEQRTTAEGAGSETETDGPKEESASSCKGNVNAQLDEVTEAKVRFPILSTLSYFG